MRVPAQPSSIYDRSGNMLAALHESSAWHPRHFTCNRHCIRCYGKPSVTSAARMQWICLCCLQLHVVGHGRWELCSRWHETAASLSRGLDPLYHKNTHRGLEAIETVRREHGWTWCRRARNRGSAGWSPLELSSTAVDPSLWSQRESFTTDNIRQRSISRDTSILSP